METITVSYKDGRIVAQMTGHPTEVIRMFHEIASAILGGKGPWRISEVHGKCDWGKVFDSDMTWMLVAELKSH